MTNVSSFARGSWAIALYTCREGIRKKTLIGFLVLSVLVIFGSQFITAFMAETMTGDVKSDVDVKLIKDICVTAISLFGILITIFISASVVPTEVENKVVYTVISKPVSRFQYLLGKFMGVQLIVLLNLMLMGGLFFFALYFKQHVLPTLLLWSILLTYFQFLIVSAFTFAVSCTASSSVLPTIAGLFIYITGHLVEYLDDVYFKAGQTGQALDIWIGRIAWALHRILPDLKMFSLKDDILYLPVNDRPSEAIVSQLILYGLVYALSGYLIAYWVFRRREF